jgi:hypothetical protein
MLIFYIQFTLQFYVKNFIDDLFIADVSDSLTRRSLKPVFETERMDYLPIIRPDGGLIIGSASNNQVWGVGLDNILSYYPINNQPNQIFSLVMVGPKTYVIKSMEYCIEYIPELRIYKAAKCTGSNYQKFIVITKEDDYTADIIGCITEKYYNDALGYNSIRSSHCDNYFQTHEGYYNGRGHPYGSKYGYLKGNYFGRIIGHIKEKYYNMGYGFTKGNYYGGVYGYPGSYLGYTPGDYYGSGDGYYANLNRYVNVNSYNPLNNLQRRAQNIP